MLRGLEMVSSSVTGAHNWGVHGLKVWVERMGGLHPILAQKGDEG